MTFAILEEILTKIFKAVFKYWKITLAAIMLLALIIFVALETHRLHEAERVERKARAEANAAREKTEGLQILINSNNQAQEIEKEKQYANQQANNSNLAADNFNDSVHTDSGEFSDSFDAARERFCKNFPGDSKCRR